MSAASIERARPSSRRRRGAGFPDEAQELLLHAALDDDAGARAAWLAWSRRVDFERLDGGSYRLLPLLSTRLTELGIDHAWLGRIKGVYKTTWYRNQIAARDLGVVLAALEERGLAPLVVKGVALSTLYYKSPGARPMGDVDVAVHPRDIGAAFEALRAHGWATWTPEPERYVDVFHAHNFKRPGQTQVDLHWNVLTLTPGARAFEAFAAGARPLVVGPLATRTLDAAGHLVHALVHGIAWSPEVGIRWVADAVKIARGEPIDWERVVRLAKLLEATLPVRDGLRYLRERFDVAVPADVLARLAAVRPSGFEAAFYRIHRRDRSRSVSAAVAYTLCEHAWRTRAMPLWRRVALLPRFLELKLESPGLTRLPRALRARLAAREEARRKLEAVHAAAR